MIKFFRKIRHKLITENKVSKYLLYGIGEIVLVVIGILIALNINNQNELKKNEQAVIASLKEIQNDLLIDIRSSQIFVDDYLKMDSIKVKIFDFESPWTYEDYKNGNFKILGNLYYSFLAKKNGYESLTRQIDYMPKKFDNTLNDIKILYVDMLDDIEIYNERIQHTVYTNLDWNYDQNWTLHQLKYGETSKEEIDYYIYDDRYKKYILKYWNDIENIFKSSQKYRIKAIETYIKIDSILINKDKELPLYALGKITSKNDIEKYLGIYTFSDEAIPFSAKLFIENNQLYSVNNSSLKRKHYKLNEELYMFMNSNPYYPVIWKFRKTKEGKISMHFLNANVPDLFKKND